MNAKIAHEGNVLVVYLTGRIDYEGMESFRHTCLTQLVGKTLIFNFSRLVFVGSIGVSGFIETLITLAQKTAGGIRLCEVGPEFRRMIQARNLNGLEIFESLELAKQSLAQVAEGAMGSENSSLTGSSAAEADGPAAP